MDVTMLLCDAAEVQGGKLYILGGGWSVIWAPGVPINMVLAVKLAIPWDQANQPHRIRAALRTLDGDPVDAGQGDVAAEGDLEVGRPAGLKPGSPLDAPFVLPFNGLILDPGGYLWILEIDGTEMARAPFRVEQGLPG
jgi:hypothetical protein